MSARVRIAQAPGDGIGPEIMDAVLDVFRAAGVLEHVEFLPVEMGKKVLDAGITRGLTDEAVRTVESCGILFKGPMETPKSEGGKSVNVTVRKLWSAYANLRHFVSLPGVHTVFSRANIPLDFLVVRENIEDTYGGIEHRVTTDVVQCKRLITAPGSEQVHRFAFETARRRGIRKIACAHKANIMKMSDGLFLERFRAVARDFPEIEASDVIIDALCMNLVLKPEKYEMIVLPNLQGDIVSDLAAGLVGGLGFAPSANIGNHIAIFEAVHGTAPDIAGQGLANPTALLLSGLMMLRHVGLDREAALIDNALLAALEEGCRTGDFGDRGAPALGTRAFARAVSDRLGQNPRRVAPRPVPDASTPHAPPGERPTSPRMMRLLPDASTEVVGADLYLETTIPAAELAREIEALLQGSPLRLTMISNRGTQVWPTGSVFTECVDYYRIRLERRGQGLTREATHTALSAVDARFPVTVFELLRSFGGVPGFSRAQGQ